MGERGNNKADIERKLDEALALIEQLKTALAAQTERLKIIEKVASGK